MIGTGVGRVLAGVIVVVVAAATALAFATIDPPPLKPRKKAEAEATQPAAAPATAEAPTPTPALDEKLPQAALPPPPTPSDFGSPQPAEPAESPAEIEKTPIDELRARANDKNVLAMEELGRRLIQGADVPKDAQAGAGWLMRAADLGSAQSAFNVGVMYERGFVVERDSAKAVEWYRRAADANIAAAKHNLALLLRDGKGAPRDTTAAIALLKSAARQGMAASLFSLGDIYDRGDAAPRDPVEALAWFAIAAELDRQINNSPDTPLSRAADQRAQTLQRTLTPEELARAQDRAQGEFRTIVDALAPARPRPQPAPPPAAEAAPASPPAEAAPAAWPGNPADQVRLIQQTLFDLKLSRDKPDGTLGPATKAAIRAFQKSAGLRETGEVTKDLYLALAQTRSQRDIVAASPLPVPAKVEAPPPSPPQKEPEPAPAPPPKPVATINLPTPEAPPLPSAAEFARALPKIEAAKVDPPKPATPTVDTTKPEPAKVEAAPPPADPNAWPTSRVDQVKAIQAILRDLKFYNAPLDGVANVGTRNAIRDYEKMAGLKETGEPSKQVFDSLKEMRALMGGKR